MRELEFLPRWYRQATRHRRLVIAQACATVAVGVALCTWVGIVRHDVAIRRSEIADLQGKIQAKQSQWRTFTALRARLKD